MTKYRHEVFTSRPLARMEEIMRDVCADFGTELREVTGTPITSRLVTSLKAVSSPQAAAGAPGTAPPLLASRAAVVRVLLRRSVGGAPITALRQYNEQQNRPS